MPKKTIRSTQCLGYSHVTNDENEEGKVALEIKRQSREQDAECLFNEYKHLFSPGRFFKFVSKLYGERKIFIIIMIHLFATLVIWAHFFLIKFQQLEHNVPIGANYYWAKRIIPSLEFGSMHAILFQMALLPLSMSRYTISSLSNSLFDKFFPLNKMLRMHIHMGYTMAALVFTAAIVFFSFFGSLCSRGEQEFCDKFKAEIMQTGYLLVFVMILIAATAFMRHKAISYETFYLFHSLIIVLYILSIIHTFDNAHRSGEKSRSQNVKWFSAPALYYLCDYAMLYINQRYTTEVTSFLAMKGKGSRMAMLKLRRPTLFRFKPGQHAFLRAPDVDRYWHPFSIASNPNSNHVDFYMEIYGTGSWTHRVWDTLMKRNSEPFRMEIMGPCGTGIVNDEEYSQVIAVGSGTGIVPILSVFKEHVQKLLQLNPTHHQESQHDREIQLMNICQANESRAAPIFRQLISSAVRCTGHSTTSDAKERKADKKTDRVKNALSRLSLDQGQDNAAVGVGIQPTVCPKKEMNRAIFSATKSIYSRLLIAILTSYGVLVIGLFISWTTIKIECYNGMLEALAFTVTSYQGVFAMLSIFVWNGNSLISHTDFIISISSPFIDWYLISQYNTNKYLSPAQITAEAIFLTYIMGRMWWRSISGESSSGGLRALPVLDNLNIVWVTKSAKLASRILPDITYQWDRLVEKWGDDIFRVCEISIFVTDTNPRALRRLKDKASTLSLGSHIFYHRPDFQKILEMHTLSTIRNHEYSSSLLAFCGSKRVSIVVEQAKIANDLLVVMSGYKRHRMDFKSECHGSPRTGKFIEEKVDKNGSEQSADKTQIIIHDSNEVSSNDENDSTYLSLVFPGEEPPMHHSCSDIMILP